MTDSATSEQASTEAPGRGTSMLIGLALISFDWRLRARIPGWIKQARVTTAISVAAIVLVVTANFKFWFGLLLLALLVGVYFLVRLIPGGKRLTNWLVPPEGSKKTADTLVVIVMSS